jgi:hypothetical protein
MTTPTEFELACTKEAAGTPWPDLQILFKAIDDSLVKAPVVIVQTRSCVRCTKPVEGDRCPSCRAIQSSYVSAS